jgi:hypothetical protein
MTEDQARYEPSFEGSDQVKAYMKTLVCHFCMSDHGVCTPDSFGWFLTVPSLPLVSICVSDIKD